MSTTLASLVITPPLLPPITSLADLMLMLPELHPTCLSRINVATLKQLRLVSKEICEMAQNSVVSCYVHVGDVGLSPSPQQLVSFLGGAKLQQLVVIVHVTTGPMAFTAAEQLSVCDHQMERLLSGMGEAMKTITKLTLKVVGKNSEPTSSQQQQRKRNPPAQAYAPKYDLSDPSASDPRTESDSEVSLYSPTCTRSCPQELAFVAASVFQTLALAVPNLFELHLRGTCWDAGLHTFGASCSRLAKLDIDPRNVPVQALQNVGQHLPCLTTLSVKNYLLRDTDQSNLHIFLNKVMVEARHCLSLTSLNIEVTEYLSIVCLPQSLANLPTSLHTLHCSCHVVSSPQFRTLIRRLPSLALPYPPIRNSHLLEIFQQFPLLENLTVMESEAVSILCAKDDFSSGHSLLKERLLARAFHLSSVHVSFSGTCAELRDMFAWLPVFLDVPEVTIEFVGTDAKLHCLERLPYLFPNLKHLALAGKMAAAMTVSEGHATEDMDMLFFKPLAACPHLRRLGVSCTNLSLTTTGLIQLCAGLAKLDQLEVKACKGVVEDDIARLIVGAAQQVPLIHVST